MNPRMTDEQTWIIASAPANVSSRQLADQLGLKVATVNARRWAIRQDGWTCRVRYAECLHCGEMMTMPPNRSRTDRPYHPECRKEHRRMELNRSYLTLPSGTKRHRQERARKIVEDWQHASIQNAVNRGARWTESEDTYLEANMHRTAHELAAELNRSFYGVAGRLKRVRHR